MSTPDALWRLAASYGRLIGMGLGLMMAGTVVAIMWWHRKIRWKNVALGSTGVVLLSFSLWMSHDLAIA